MTNKLILTFTLLLFLVSGLVAQNQDTLLEKHEKVPVEKIYLHTDRELYLTGDTVWLKSYLTDSRSGRLLPGKENVYLQLTGESGQSLLNINLMSLNGQATGQFFLPDTLLPGNYLLSAHTDYLLNFGNDAFFYKILSIIESDKSPNQAKEVKNNDILTYEMADISFLPEGGKILEGVTNLVAFKAIDKNGYGVDVSGSVKDNSGIEAVTFKSDYKGMGIFFFTPEIGKSYNAVINEKPSFQVNFDSLVVSGGIKIQLVNQTSRDVLLNITGNSERYLNETFYIVNMHRGNVIFYQQIQIESQNQLIRIENQMLKVGINQLVLLDHQFMPVSERLVFSDNGNTGELKITPDKEQYGRRSEVKMLIAGNDTTDEILNLSASVIHDAVYPKENPGQTILSSLLISSELKGFIESPADFFTDSVISAQAKQRLLMLTNGWSSYFWNTVPITGTELKYQQKAGLELYGTATNSHTGAALNKGEITMVVEKNGEMAILEQNTDDNGKFMFPGLLFYDTATVYVQAKSQRRRQLTDITLLSEESIPVSSDYIQSLNKNIYSPVESKNRVLESLEAERRRIAIRTRPRKPKQMEPNLSGDGHFRLYEQADQVIEVPEKVASFGNIIDYIEGKVAGLDVSGDVISLRGASTISGSSSPLFLIDGIPLADTRRMDGISENNDNDIFRDEISSSVRKVKSIPIGDIEKVEILKNPQNLAIFGVDGANGVIAIYTRQGKEDKKEVIKEVLEQKIAGFSSYRQFYAPRYVPGNRLSRAPDIRATLFWEPEISMENGQDSLSFYTSDLSGRYHIIVEGISESGKICYGMGMFDVK